jgi:ATP-dependent RNA helicase DHX37/DHR1
MEEQEIVEKITDNDVTIICGATGSGKTTQVPQFLYESGYGEKGMIGITQPRRVSAVSMAKRVATELGDKAGHVGYQIRYDKTSSSSTKVKFMTDGILLREIESDFALSRYSAIIIDEAHERNTNTDILIGLLSRIVPLRRSLAQEKRPAIEGGEPTCPLKLIIMSATLRVEDFSANQRLFPTAPPIVTVGSRQYSVANHFNKKTAFTDYVDEAFSKVSKIHTRLPKGGVLVFLTGQHEIEQLCKKLRDRFPKSLINNPKLQEELEAEENREKLRQESSAPTAKSNGDKEEQQSKGNGADANGAEDGNNNIDEEAIDDELYELSETDSEESDYEELDEDIADKVRKMEREERTRLYGDDDRDIAEDDLAEEKLDDLLSDKEKDNDGTKANVPEKHWETRNDGKAVRPLFVLPLYGALSPGSQQRVFAKPPKGYRLCVVATNVAETAITIPDVSYVVDSGRVKERVFDLRSGISRFEVKWESKASADQRSGRAGRTGPGHCYRLYSSSLFEHYFEQFSTPEISRTPAESVVLTMKSMGIDNIERFPFPTPLNSDALRVSVKLLQNIGILSADSKQELTPLGKAVAPLPIHPRLGKMLVLANESSCLPWMLTIVASLSIKELFLPLFHGTHEQDDNERQGSTAQPKDEKQDEVKVKPHKECVLLWKNTDSDALAALKAVEACKAECGEINVEPFCRKYRLHARGMKEIFLLRKQLAHCITAPLVSCPPPNAKQLLIIRQLITAGLVDKIGIQISTDEAGRFNIPRKGAYWVTDVDFPVVIHNTSFLSRDAPQCIAYFEIIGSSSGVPAASPFSFTPSVGEWKLGDKLYSVRTVTKVHPSWLHSLAPQMVRFSQPLADRQPTYSREHGDVRCFVNTFYGPKNWELPLCIIPIPDDSIAVCLLSAYFFVYLFFLRY